MNRYASLSLLLIFTICFFFFSSLSEGSAGKVDPTFGLLYCSDQPLKITDLQPQPEKNQENIFKTEWHFSSKKAKFIAVVTHGLNLKPSRMDKIVQYLQFSGGDILQVALPGHRYLQSDEGVEPYVSWSGHLRASLCLAKERARDSGKIPTFFIGFSLGGGLYEEILAQNTEQMYQVDGVVLFAPAISLRFYAHLIPIFFFLDEEFFLPSWTPSSYRVFSGIKIKHYRSLFRMMDQLHNNASSRLNLPTLIFIDAKDEMVSPKGIDSFIKKHSLSSWKIREISRPNSFWASLQDQKFHHLIIDPESLGQQNWEKIRYEMLTHLFQSARMTPPPDFAGP